jgi:hypothetical protein
MVAVPLIFGRLTAEDYNDDVAADPRIDALRDKMVVTENPQFTKDYFDPEKALHRQFGAGVLQGRQQHRKGLDRLSDRPPQAPRRGYPRAFEEVRGAPCAGICRRTALRPFWRPRRIRLNWMPCLSSRSWVSSRCKDSVKGKCNVIRRDFADRLDFVKLRNAGCGNFRRKFVNWIQNVIAR